MITPEQLAASGTEHGEQAALFLWALMNRRNDPRLELLFAIPNGGERNKATAGRLKAEGVKSGVPDLFLPVVGLKWSDPDKGIPYYHGLFIEMKKPAERYKNKAATHKWDTGGVKENQVIWLTLLEQQGYKCVVCYHWYEAANEIKFYLTGTGLISLTDMERV